MLRDAIETHRGRSESEALLFLSNLLLLSKKEWSSVLLIANAVGNGFSHCSALRHSRLDQSKVKLSLRWSGSRKALSKSTQR